MKILSVVGTRPNFIKVAPLHKAFLAYPNIESKIVHTGQHYDSRLSAVFFHQLDLPEPDYYLSVRTDTSTRQTADMLLEFEQVLLREQPDWVLVVGDVTSTLACALTASQVNVRIAHVEAGLRSGDRQMPEERNRIVTDALADLLFVTEQAGICNLRREGVPDERIHFVGNVMIDTLAEYRQKATDLATVDAMGLIPGGYVLMTMHRPGNVDSEEGLKRILKVVDDTACRKTVLFALHPRTRASLARHDLLTRLIETPNVRLLEPQGYLEFLNLMERAAVVITDSGGIQEETTYINVPCLTFRNSTERPVTVELGSNQLLADLKPETVQQKLDEILEGRAKMGSIPPLWDGKTAGRIAEIMHSTEICSVKG